jgi:hypothetical protein
LHSQAQDLTQFYGDAFGKYFRPSDLTYGDSMFASQRLTEALVRFYTQYVPLLPDFAANLSRTATSVLRNL